MSSISDVVSYIWYMLDNITQMEVESRINGNLNRLFGHDKAFNLEDWRTNLLYLIFNKNSTNPRMSKKRV